MQVFWVNQETLSLVDSPLKRGLTTALTVKKEVAMPGKITLSVIEDDNAKEGE